MIEFRSICVIFSSICFVSFRSQMLKDDSCESSLDPVVRCTKEGPVRGKRLDFNVHRSNSNKNKLSVDIFLGIPYAEPPTGERRFRKSKPISSRNRSTIFDATKYSNSCYQMIIDFLNATGEKIWAPTTSMSEDCLYLNIWKPNRVTSHKQNLPVMVWIYGGGFTSGSSTLKVYDGSILSATQNVIVVSIEYRVESLGFLYLGTDDAPGNQGFHDQILALEWIQKNIHYFSGDPNRVTLFGESAGAVSVGLHLLSPKSRSLFNNAILQSSGPTAKWAVLSPKIAKYRSEKFLNALTRYISERFRLSARNSDEHLSIPIQCRKTLITIQEKFDCVRFYPIRDIEHFRSVWSMESYNGDPVGFTFVLTIDADLIPYDPEVMLLNGDFKRSPILLGVNQDEGSYFNVYLPHGNLTHYAAPSVDYSTFQMVLGEYFRHLPTYPLQRTKPLFDSILQTYTIWNDFNNTLNNAIQLNHAVGDYHFTCPTIFLADLYAKSRTPVYFYHFTLRSSVSPWHPWMGVLHADEIMFVFGEPLNMTDDLDYTEEEIFISEKLMSYWTNFAKYSNPNQVNDHQWANEWHQYEWPSRHYINLSINLADRQMPEHGQALRANFCAFWIDYLPKLMSATASVSDDERRWREEFQSYSERIQQWEYYYVKYVQMIEKSKEKFLGCIG